MSNNPVSFIDPDGGYDHMTDEQIAARAEERRRERYEETWDRASDQGRSSEYSGARSNSGQLGASMRTEAEYLEYMRETAPSSQTIRHFDLDKGMPWSETTILGGYGADGGPQGPPVGRTITLPGAGLGSLIPELAPWLNTNPISAILHSTSMGDQVPLSTIAQWQAMAKAEADKKANEYVTLYRGVDNNIKDGRQINAFQYEAALIGMAIPRGLVQSGPVYDSPNDHTYGSTEQSLHTSWSQYEDEAIKRARKSAPGGILLTKQFPRSVLSQTSLASRNPIFADEDEILIFGVQIGAASRVIP